MKSDSDPGARRPPSTTPATDTLIPRPRPKRDGIGGAGSRSAADAEADAAKRAVLSRCLELEHDGILKHLRIAIAIAGIARNKADVETLAFELLGPVSEEVLSNASKFDLSHLPFPWIRGFCLNLVNRRRAEMIRDNDRLCYTSSFSSSSSGPQPDVELSPAEVFDILLRHSAHPLSDSADSGDPYILVSASESHAEVAAFVRDLLARLDPVDREVLTLAANHDMNRAIVAEKLGISRFATHQRYYRALDRARAAAGETTDPRRVIEYRKDQNR